MPPKTTKKQPKFRMTDEHKDALAIGRQQGRVVRRYLEALEASKPKRGRKRTIDTIQRRLDEVEAQLAEADPLSRVRLIQERLDLRRELDAMDEGIDVQALEEEFVEVAADYGSRKGITYAAWREVGVDPGVLKRAGISRAE